MRITDLLDERSISLMTSIQQINSEDFGYGRGT